MTQSNLEYEKIRRKLSGNHPRQNKLTQAHFSRLADLKNAPNLDHGHLTLMGLLHSVRVAKEALTRHGIGEVAIVEAVTNQGVLLIEIGWFYALNKIKEAEVIGSTTKDDVLHFRVGPTSGLLWRRPKGVGNHG